MEFYTFYQYDFKIEFYPIKLEDGVYVKDKNGETVLEENPKYIIETHAGNPFITFETSHRYSNYSCFTSKKGTLKIYNLPLDFNEEIQPNWGLKLYYKQHGSSFVEEAKYSLVIFGRIYNPEETDFYNGDFEIKYEILTQLDLGTNFLENKFTPPMQLKGMTVVEAIQTIYGERAVIRLSEEEQNTVIKEEMAIINPNDFQDKMTNSKNSYITSIYTDLADPDKDFGSVMVFVGKSDIRPDEEYEPLERYGLDFIPQQQKVYNSEYNYYITFWKCNILYTNTLRIGSKVSFVDTLGNTRKCMIDQYSVSLSSSGECTISLKLYDEVINAISLIGASEELQEKEAKEEAIKEGAPPEVVEKIEVPKTVASKPLPKPEKFDINKIMKDASAGASSKISNSLSKSLNELKNIGPTQSEINKMNKQMEQNMSVVKIGVIDSYDARTQQGVVIIKDFNNLKIKCKNISNIHLNLQKGDKVALIQASLDLFNARNTIPFDKNNFYIISSIEPKHLSLSTSKLTFNANDIEINASKPIKFGTKSESLRNLLKSLVKEIRELKMVGGPGGNVVSPDNVASLIALSTRIDNLLK